MCSYSSVCLSVTFLGSFFPPKQASAAGRPRETETLSAPDLNLLAPLLEGRSGWGDAQQRGLLHKQRSALMSLRHSQWLLIMVMISLQCMRGSKIPWAGFDGTYCTTHLYEENHLSLLSFIGGVGLYSLIYTLQQPSVVGAIIFFILQMRN